MSNRPSSKSFFNFDSSLTQSSYSQYIYNMTPFMSSLVGNLQPYLQSAVTLIRDRPISVAIAAGFIPLIAHIIPSYNGYMAIGPGGMPHNFLGWLMQAIAQPLGRTDLTSVSPYRDPKNIAKYEPHGRESFLGHENLPARRGARPEVPGYIAPQRQTTEKGNEELVRRLNSILSAFASQNPDLLTIKPSNLEHPKYSALWVNLDKPHLPNHLQRTNGELFHVHDEGSSHVILSLADAEEVICKGWGLKHKLSGVVIPWTYVMVYAPRDEGEVEVWRRILGAAIGFSGAQLGREVDLKSL